MKYVLALALALVLGATPLHARDDVTPEQVEALKKRIASIDDWLKDAEKDRSSLEQQPVSYTHLTLPTILRV